MEKKDHKRLSYTDPITIVADVCFLVGYKPENGSPIIVIVKIIIIIIL